MKFTAHSLLLVSLAATFAYSQPTNNIPQVQHVIVVIQENRTPDNLFNQDTLLAQNGGHVRPTNNAGPCNVPGHSTISLSPTPLFTCWDPTHNHAGAHPSWITTWDNGAMDGACGNYISGISNQCQTSSCVVSTNPYYSTCGYTYVQNTPWNGQNGVLDPYFQLANQYGWANYMFQTNQGPSFPAHQFLFSGTSAPIRYNDPLSNCFGIYPNEKCWQWFDAENTTAGKGDPTGCVAKSGVHAYLIDTNSSENLGYVPPQPVNNAGAGFPCYTHNSLPTLLDNANITWRYYLREGYNGGCNLWNAASAIDDICGTTGPDGSCQGGEYLVNVNSVLPGGPNYPHDKAPILTDIANCALPQVSWVIPDGNWSDHAGGPTNEKGDGGPSWVANIVNAIGAGGNCDNPVGYWGDTVILVVWDDWGGYYDDVVPLNCGPNQPCGYSNGTGQQYVYGFRVPFLAISAYAKQTAQPPAAYTGYVSNVNHDFGSILNFIEYAFGTGGNPLGGKYGIGDVNWQYADFFAPDVTPQGPNPYGLSDFFTYTQSNPTPIPFRQITPLEYPADCFHRPGDNGCFGTYPLDPDNDANESD